MASKKKTTAQPTPVPSDAAADSTLLDPVVGKAAYERLAGELAAFPPEEIEPPRANVQQGAILAIAAARLVNRPENRSKFAPLPAEYFDHSALDLLDDWAQAVWYLAVEARVSSVGENNVKLPVALVDEATELRSRMFSLAWFLFEDDPELGPELIDIRKDTGYVDLATDLSRLARIYHANAALVAQVPRRYQPSDAAEAARLAQTIMKEFAPRPAGERGKLLAAAWSSLRRCYDEIRDGWRYIHRHDAQQLDAIPSIFAASRRKRRTVTEEAALPPTNGTSAPSESADAGSF